METKYKIKTTITEQDDKFSYFSVSTMLNDVGVRLRISNRSLSALGGSVGAINKIILDVINLIKSGKVKTRRTGFIYEAANLIEGMIPGTIEDNWATFGKIHIDYKYNGKGYTVTFEKLYIY